MKVQAIDLSLSKFIIRFHTEKKNVKFFIRNRLYFMEGISHGYIGTGTRPDTAPDKI